MLVALPLSFCLPGLLRFEQWLSRALEKDASPPVRLGARVPVAQVLLKYLEHSMEYWSEPI
jgi:hypothetical protein